jgi:meso-butanediol dehydrogenase/(S,S)-butanediol dehydrogenase/diacetyl reductase
MKVALVTGSARGIGLATTKQFLAKGWRVAMVDWDGDELALSAKSLENIITLDHDIAQTQDVARIVSKTLEAFGQIDALVNNAGVADFGPIEETDYERWRRIMSINLDGTFLLSQAATDAL